MTKQIELKGKTCLLVDVPADTHGWELVEVIDTGDKVLLFKEGGKDILYLPNGIVNVPGNWRILGSGKASEITEDEWKEIVERVDDGKWFKDYTGTQDLWFTAAESGLSLLSYNGFKKESTVILVKE